MNDPHSKIAKQPDDMESLLLIDAFNSVFFTDSGMDYKSVKDALKWRGLSPKKYVTIIQRLYREFKSGVEIGKA